MSKIHYKFSSSKDLSSVTFDGISISLKDLKELISSNANAGNAQDIDLKIFNAQSNEEYKGDAAMVMKNTTVTVKRVPLAGRRPQKPLPYVDAGSLAASANSVNAATAANAAPGDSGGYNAANQYSGHPSSHSRFGGIPRPQPGGFYNKPVALLIDHPTNGHARALLNHGIGRPAASSAADPADPDSTGTGSDDKTSASSLESQRIKNMMSAAGAEYVDVQKTFQSNRGAYFSERSTVPPENYICHRCGNGGHYIKQCQKAQDYTIEVKKLSRPTGIPKVFLRTLDHYQPGAVMQADGTFAISRVDEEMEQGDPQLPAATANGNSGTSGPNIAAGDGLPDAKRLKPDYTTTSNGPLNPVQQPPSLLPGRTSNAPLVSSASKATSKVTSVMHPKKFTCPLDGRLYVNPELTPCCAENYCKACIRAYLKMHKMQCPSCRARLPPSQLSPNTSLQKAVADYRLSI